MLPNTYWFRLRLLNEDHRRRRKDWYNCLNSGHMKLRLVRGIDDINARIQGNDFKAQLKIFTRPCGNSNKTVNWFAHLKWS